MKLLCLIFGHRYVAIYVGEQREQLSPGLWSGWNGERVCMRCGDCGKFWNAWYAGGRTTLPDGVALAIVEEGRP